MNTSDVEFAEHVNKTYTFWNQDALIIWVVLGIIVGILIIYQIYDMVRMWENDKME